MKRQSRLLAITEYFRSRRTGVTAEQLAERFGVTVRTIYRDLDDLRDANFPVHGEQGRGGGYVLDRHYALPPINLNAREAALLVALGTHAVRMRLLPFSSTVQSALDKVRGALSTSSQREVLQLLEQLHFVGVPAQRCSPGVLRVLEDAWFGQRSVELTYRRADDTRSVRTVLIEKVLMERSLTLLNVVDTTTKERRQYVLSRVERAVLTPAGA